MRSYKDTSLPAAERARLLLEEMSADEKLYQLSADMIFEVGEDYESRRDPMPGSFRNPGHFMHYDRPEPAAAGEVARRINRDVELSIAAQPRGIPPIENGEALHGAQWGMGTCFPQPIGMASTFDPELTYKIGRAIGKECAAVGVRQVFSPVVNLARDCRWGRTVETYGEDVKLSSDMGAAMCRGLMEEGVIATPKHFADNYAAGGRDSNYSEISERTMREVILPPFKACIDAGAGSVMAAYNAWEGVPCSCSERLLTEILRDEWGFEGFVVSDYGGVDGICGAHGLCQTQEAAAAAAVNAGLDVLLPYNRFDTLKNAYESGLLKEDALDRAVLRVLTAKFRLGLFEAPFADADAADGKVRTAEHKELAYKSACESLILLQNDGVLPLKPRKGSVIGVFGSGALKVPVGDNYSGPYGRGWEAKDALTPLDALKACFDGVAEIRYFDESDSAASAAECDFALYFTSLIEGEGKDRSDLRLPGIRRAKSSEGAGVIVDDSDQSVTEDQEKRILDIAANNKKLIVVILGGAPVDVSAWEDGAAAIVEAWYPGEQGARAICGLIRGEFSPSGKTPVTFPRSVGQLPLYYSYKPSGRGYGYSENDGSPRWPFGYGLSYTSFEISDAEPEREGDSYSVAFSIKNTGGIAGAEVVQLYVGARNCGVVMPVKRLVAYRRVDLAAGESRRVSIPVPGDAFCYYDRQMRYGSHGGDFTLMLGTSCEDIVQSFEC